MWSCWRPACVQSRERFQGTRLALSGSSSRRRRWRQAQARSGRRIHGAERRLGDRRRTLYVHAGLEFRWFRSRIVGGRTNHWGRIALRFAPVDFRSRSTDGMGDDWPITYEEVAPYYDKVESYIGVFGTKENIPSAPDGVFLPPPPPRCTETIVKKACDKLNILCVPSRLAISDQTSERARGLPLLRTMRARMPHRVEFQFQPGDDSAGASYRAIHLDHRGDGARNRGRERRQG